MRKRIFPIAVCLAALVFSSAEAKHMSVDEYRKCREAFFCSYNDGTNTLRTPLETADVSDYARIIKKNARRICDSLGFSFGKFNQANKRYGMTGLTYEQVVRNYMFLSFTGKNPAIIKKYQSREEARHALWLDLNIGLSRPLAIGKEDVRFDGFRVELDSLPGILRMYKLVMKESFKSNTALTKKIVKEQGGIVVGKDIRNKDYTRYAFTLPPYINLKVEHGLLNSEVWPVINILVRENAVNMSTPSFLTDWDLMFCLAPPTLSTYQRITFKWIYAGCVIPGSSIVTPAGDTQSLESVADFLKINTEDLYIPRFFLTAQTDLPFDLLILAIDSLQNYYIRGDVAIDYYLASPDIYESYESKSLAWPDSLKEER